MVGSFGQAGNATPIVTELSCGEESIASPTWEQVKSLLIDLPDEKTVSISVGDDAWLIALHSASIGYLVTGNGQGERDYFTLIDRNLGDEPVTAFDGGNENEHPRYAFVGESLALKVFEIFYLTGNRDGDAEWVQAQDAMY